MTRRKILVLGLSLFLFLNFTGCSAAGEDPQDGVYGPDKATVPGPGSSTSYKTAESGKWSDGWYQGAAGYAKALEEYENTDKAMLVYFSTAWCPYCRKLEKEIFLSPQVRDFLRGQIKVNLNPEVSRRESALSYQYRVMGFPSIYVHAPRQGRTIRLYTGVTPEEFIDLFKQAIQ